MQAIPALLYTENEGSVWLKSKVYGLDGTQITYDKSYIKVFSDRVWPDVFYGFGENSRLFVSLNKAKTFQEVKLPDAFPSLYLPGIDSKQHYEIRVQRESPGVIWLSLAEDGLWRLTIEKESCMVKVKTEQISQTGDTVYRVGLGKADRQDGPQTIFINGIIDKEYGFYRSLDGGVSFQRINNEKQMFGDIRSICGDPRTFGRFYIATGTRGVLWGEPEPMT